MGIFLQGYRSRQNGISAGGISLKKSLKNIDIKGQRVIVRVDYNVPIVNGEISDDTRLRATIPTLQYLIRNKAKTILISHLGRPKGKFVKELSLAIVAEKLSKLLGREIKMCPVAICNESKEAVKNLKEGEILILENIRFYNQESENNEQFAKEIALLGDIYVNDAFGTSHREHASVVGIPKFLPSAAGLLLEAELNALNILLENPKRPFVAVLGGNKISDKLGIITSFLDKVDALLIGGGMCFTFLKSQGVSIGNSICENDQLNEAREILSLAKNNNVELRLPVDIVVAENTSPDAPFKIVDATQIPDDWIGLDIGPLSVKLFTDTLNKAKTIFWNGPLGLFEIDQFGFGTKKIAETIAYSEATTIVGGGDTDAALKKYKLTEKITHVSTGGGASMRLLEGKKLPGVEVLDEE